MHSSPWQRSCLGFMYVLSQQNLRHRPAHTYSRLAGEALRSTAATAPTVSPGCPSGLHLPVAASKRVTVSFRPVDASSNAQTGAPVASSARLTSRAAAGDAPPRAPTGAQLWRGSRVRGRGRVSWLAAINLEGLLRSSSAAASLGLLECSGRHACVPHQAAILLEWLPPGWRRRGLARRWRDNGERIACTGAGSRRAEGAEECCTGCQLAMRLWAGPTSIAAPHSSCRGLRKGAFAGSGCMQLPMHHPLESCLLP